MSHNAEKIEKGDPLAFFNIINSVAKLQKNEGGTLWWKKIRKKSRTMPKKLNGGPFSLARYCMIRGKKEKKLF